MANAKTKTEQDLLKTSERCVALLGAIPEIIMEVDTKKVYTWANQFGYDFFGKDVIGKEASYYFEGEQKTYDIVESLFKGDPNTFYVESWQRRTDGQKRLLAWWCRSLKDENDNIIGALSVARDITEKKKEEEMLKKTKKELEEKIAELEKMNNYMIDREKKMIELKGKIKDLEEELELKK